MPYFASWLLTTPASVESGGNAAPIVPVSGGAVECDAVMYDKQHFLDLFDRLYPFDYLAPMKASRNAGYEAFQAWAALGERISLAAERLECGNIIMSAPGPSRATGTVEFYRTEATSGAFTVLKGTVVATSRGDRRFRTTSDVSFGSLSLGPVTANVEAVDYGYEYNVPGQLITPTSSITLEGEIDTVYAAVTSPGYIPELKVKQILPTTGGVPAMLDALGADRGLTRGQGESDDAFRLRVRTLADTVSPGAIKRAAAAALNPYGLSWQFIETWDVAYQTAYDAPSPNSGTPTYQATPPTNPRYDSTLFVYDDPRPEYPFRNRYLDDVEARGAFIIAVRNTTLYDVGLAYDDPGATPADFHNPTTGRSRGTAAYDLTSSMNPNLVFPSVYDGFDTLKASIYSGLYNTLQEIKAGGVTAIIEEVP